jgi:hypothetical protein
MNRNRGRGGRKSSSSRTITSDELDISESDSAVQDDENCSTRTAIMHCVETNNTSVVLKDNDNSLITVNINSTETSNDDSFDENFIFKYTGKKRRKYYIKY